MTSSTAAPAMTFWKAAPIWTASLAAAAMMYLLAGKVTTPSRGGTGADILSGGSDSDTFSFRATDGPGDVIVDFRSDQFDLIDLSATAPGTLTFRGTAAFNAPNQVRYVVTGDGVNVQVNLAGNNGSELTIKVLAATSLDADDFIL